MKKILLGLLVIAMALALTACSQETYSKLAENMGKLSENVYNIEANPHDVNEATATISGSVSYKEDGKADIKFEEVAKITASVSVIKNSPTNTAKLKEELAKPVASSEAEQTAVKDALTEKKGEVAAQIAAVDTTGLSDSQKEVLQSIQDTITNIQISDNPTMAELTTVAVLSEMANVAATVATAEDISVYFNEEGLTPAGQEVAGTALESLDTLKMVSEVAGMDVLNGMSPTAIMKAFSGDNNSEESEEPKALDAGALKVLSGFSKAIASLTNYITDPNSKAFSEKKYNAFVAESRAVKATYELLASAYARPASYEDCDKILDMPISHGLTTADLTRYLVASIFVTLDNLQDENGSKVGVAALANYITPEIYDALMDVSNKYADLAQAPEGIEVVWGTFINTFKSVNDPYAIKTVATLAVIMVDAEFTDLLRLNGGDGKISTWTNKLAGQGEN